MALAGIQVEFGFAGIIGNANETLNYLGAPTASENVTSPGTTTAVAPKGVDNVLNGNGQPYARVFAVADAYVAFGAAPNASTNPRALIKAGTEIVRAVKPGDKVAYIAVP